MTTHSAADEFVTTYRARHVVPVDAPPLDDGYLVVRNGRIAAIGSRRVAAGPIVDLGDAVVAPGWVNAHVHLEFSGLTRPLGVRGMSFPDWLREVIAYRREGAFDPKAAVAAGLQESLAAGVTTLGEIASTEPRQLLDRPPPFGPLVTAFVELLGLAPDRSAAQLVRLTEFVEQGDAAAVRRGISPHAPYTVGPQLLAAAVAASAERRLPLAFHLAESTAELELLRDGSGPLVELLARAGAWDATAIPRGTRPLDYLQTLSRSHRALIVHGNYLADDEVAFLAENSARMATVYCPRTHAYFRHAPHPLEKLLAVGAAVTVGTDGRCTNPDLDLRAELRFLARTLPYLSPQRIVRMGTLDGALSLGLDDEVGSLSVGKRADFVVLRAPPHDDVYAALLDEAATVARTVVAGRTVVERE